LTDFRDRWSGPHLRSEEPQITYDIAATGGATLYGTQFYAPHAGDTYIVTFTDANQSKGTRAAGAAMASWRYTKHG